MSERRIHPVFCAVALSVLALCPAGAQCSEVSQPTAATPSHAHKGLSVGNGCVDGSKGQRTGFPTTKDSEHLLSYGHGVGVAVLFRPELRLQHPSHLAAYGPGTKRTEFVVAGGLTDHF